MAHFSIDRDGVRGARAILADDPAVLQRLAGDLSASTATARTAVGTDWVGLLGALDRFRVVHTQALAAIAEASAALGGDLDLAVAASADVELAVSAAFGSALGATSAGAA